MVFGSELNNFNNGRYIGGGNTDGGGNGNGGNGGGNDNGDGGGGDENAAASTNRLQGNNSLEKVLSSVLACTGRLWWLSTNS